MIPDSVSTLIAFFLLVAPGAVWSLLRGRHEPSVKETALSEASRLVLSSVVATMASSALLLVPLWIPLHRMWRIEPLPGTGAFDRQVALALAVAATSATACGLTYLAAKIKWPTEGRIRPGRQWNHMLVSARPGDADKPYVTVGLSDGTVWKGTFLGVDTDPEDANRTLTVGHPLHRKRKDDKTFIPKSSDETPTAVLLSEATIQSIQVRYPASPAEPADGKDL